MILLWTALAAVAVWAVWRPALVEMVGRWNEDPTYSHGYLVPLFALGLLWFRRRELAAVAFRPSWWGVVVIVAGAAVQFAGSYLYVRWLQGLAMLMYLAGASLVVAGWPLLRLTWQAIGFLIFMLPLPFTIETALRAPLQRFATIASTFLLQLVGLSAIARGNIIDVEGYKLGVAEACSGLKMLITFFALATGLILVVKRPLLDKMVILASAVPIAIVSNILRIMATGVLYVTAGEKTAEFVYHDLAGYLMMPLGIGLMWLELAILDRLFVERRVEDPRDLRPLILGPELGLPGGRGVGRG
jgi:exosortase